MLKQKLQHKTISRSSNRQIPSDTTMCYVQCVSKPTLVEARSSLFSGDYTRLVCRHVCGCAELDVCIDVRDNIKMHLRHSIKLLSGKSRQQNDRMAASGAANEQ
jgi:hypothetical protein